MSLTLNSIFSSFKNYFICRVHDFTVSCTYLKGRKWGEEKRYTGNKDSHDLIELRRGEVGGNDKIYEIPTTIGTICDRISEMCTIFTFYTQFLSF